MKIAVSAVGPSLDAMMDQRFGRAAYFLVLDMESMDFVIVRNEGVSAGGGAGVQAAQTVLDRGVEAVITGNIGPNALRIFNVAKIPVYQGKAVSVKELAVLFRNGKLGRLDCPVDAHFGMGKGAN